MTVALVAVELARDDAERLLELLGERPYPEPWSARAYVSVAEALGLTVPTHIRTEAA